jgi:UDP-hydrolysing UDP-N-acetyl-D-glucosamine 2-epimerase
MSQRKICVVITARHSYSRIKTALQAIQSHPDLELQLVVAASALLDRYGSAVDYIERDGFEIAARVFMVLEGENPTSMAKTTGIGLQEMATVFDNLKPDAVVTIADHYETLATAAAAAYMNIPLVHVQGGEVTGSIGEKVRHAVTKMADIHLVSSEPAYQRVLKLGENPRRVHLTGCPSIDLADAVYQQPALDFNPFERYGGVGASFNFNNGYLVVMQQSVTTEYEQAREHMAHTLKAVHELDLPTFLFWPTVAAGSEGTSRAIRVFREFHPDAHIRYFKNMAPLDVLRLLVNSLCLVGNSSVGIRECSDLGVPVVNIGTRQRGRDRGRHVLDVGYDAEAIKSAIQHQVQHGPYDRELLYGDGQAGERIADVLARTHLSYDKVLTY